MDIKISIVSTKEVPIPDLFNKDKYIVTYTENGGDGIPLVVLREKVKPKPADNINPSQG